MRGICLCSLAFLISALAAPAAGPAAGRQYEVQLRRNDYTSVPAPSVLRAAGFSKAILRVFSDDEKNGGLYFNNGLFPLVRPALDLWARAFASGPVPLWAWMGARKFAWLDDPNLLDSEWNAGATRRIPKLDLFNPQALELIVRLFGRLARQQVRGILIQDDLTLLRREGFSNWGKASFSRASGMAALENLMLQKGSAQNLAWEELKVKCVGTVLARIVAACHEVDPAIQVGLNIHYEAPRQAAHARSWYAFDAQAADAAGVDLFYLMAYHRQMKAEMKLSEGDNRIYFRLMLEAALKLWGPKLIVKIQIRDWQDSMLIPFAELKTYFDLIPTGVERVCFAAADPEDIDLISQIIRPAL